jgi:sulfur relay (sulfurtransferase) complex TusBCD TusD component (DsrE family)
MSGYLVFASRDPFSDRGAESMLEMCQKLCRSGEDLTVFLVENGALAARKTPKSTILTEMFKGGTKVLVDDVSLAERGISTDRLAEGIEVASIDVAVDEMASGKKTFWA